MKPSVIFPITHDLHTVLWCGPAALSACTGRPTSEIHQAIKQVRKSTKPVMGVAPSELKGAANLLGFDFRVLWSAFYKDPMGGNFWVARPKPTLAAFLRNFGPLIKKESPVIVNVTGHYVVVTDRLFVDNRTGKPVPLRVAPGRRARVKFAWAVWKLS